MFGFISNQLGANGIKSSVEDNRGFGGNALDLSKVLSGGGSLVNFFRGMQHSTANKVMAQVWASTPNAPSPSGNDEGNILTVAVWSESFSIATIKLHLPQRQQCPQGETGACTGYMFLPDSSGNCDILEVPDRMKLPQSHNGKRVYDITKEKMVEGCFYNNTAGDYSSDFKRSRMTINLKATKSINTLLVFQVRVRNPPFTPVTRGNSEFSANTYWVTVLGRSDDARRIIRPAPKILSVWTCAYSNTYWTSSCTAACGGGFSYGVRRLLHPPPMAYPAELLVNCDLPLSETRDCNVEPCNVDCKLGDWVPFADGPCSVTCGEGFMVERRRVIEGKIGNGEPCPKWDSDERFKISKCVVAKVCDAAKCTPTDEKIATDATVYGACSSICKMDADPPGQRTVTRVAERKEGTATTNEACGFEDNKNEACGIPCNYINFFPGAGRLPRLGKWANILLVFALPEANADDLYLIAPPGFEIASEEKDSTKHCLLKSHNFPRLGGCIVETLDDGRMRATFQLLNPLEHAYVAGSGKKFKPKFEMSFWAKSPEKCQGGLDDAGACKDSDKWVWHFFYSEIANTFGRSDVESDEPSTIHKGVNYAAYNVYDGDARETQWKPILPNEEEDFSKGLKATKSSREEQPSREERSDALD